MAQEAYVGFKVTMVPDPDFGLSFLVWSPIPGTCKAENVNDLLDEMMDHMTETPHPWKTWHDWWNFEGSNPKEDVK